MCGLEGVDKVFLVVEVGQGKAACAVDEDVGVCHADTGARSHQPISVDRLGNREAGRGAARVDPRSSKIIFQVHRTDIGLDSQNPMASLKVVASLAAAGETAR